MHRIYEGGRYLELCVGCWVWHIININDPHRTVDEHPGRKKSGICGISMGRYPTLLREKGASNSQMKEL